MCSLRFAFSQLLFLELALRNIPHKATECPVLVYLEGGNREFDGKLLAIPTPGRDFEASVQREGSNARAPSIHFDVLAISMLRNVRRTLPKGSRQSP